MGELDAHVPQKNGSPGKKLGIERAKQPCPAIIDSFTIDDLERLTGFTGSTATSLTYDDFGNIKE